MELRHLRYFTTVVEEQSFTKAAEKLCMAQPPLSKQIKNLEESLGVELIDRSNRPLKPTKAGEIFYANAQIILNKVTETKALTQNLQSSEDTIKIGFVVSLLYGLLPKIIYSYRMLYPNTKIELIEIGTVKQIEALKKGEIDIGFGRIRTSDPEIRRSLLREEPLSVVVSNQHPFKKHPHKITLAEISSENVLLYPNHSFPNLSTQISNIFTNHGLKLERSELVRDIQLALGLVAANEGICIVPASAAKVSVDNVSYLPIADHFATSPIISSIRETENREKVLDLFSSIKHAYNTEGMFNDEKTIDNILKELQISHKTFEKKE